MNIKLVWQFKVRKTNNINKNATRPDCPLSTCSDQLCMCPQQVCRMWQHRTKENKTENH